VYIHVAGCSPSRDGMLCCTIPIFTAAAMTCRFPTVLCNTKSLSLYLSPHTSNTHTYSSPRTVYRITHSYTSLGHSCTEYNLPIFTAAAESGVSNVGTTSTFIHSFYTTNPSEPKKLTHTGLRALLHSPGGVRGEQRGFLMALHQRSFILHDQPIRGQRHC
jgi:hypothetical protein